jgi:predicted SAM-dependent methyltransferase
MAFKRSLYDEIGPFDESLWPCSGEEVDFCYRAKQKGYNIGIAKDIYVHHHGSQTFLDMQNKGQLNYQDVCNKTDNHLESRWGKGVFVQEIIKEESKDVNAVRLNLGCGYRKLDGYINIDNRKEIEPDACVDIICGLPYSDSSIDEIIASDFLEHIPIGKVIFVMEEIWRVLKPNGIFESLTPSTDGRGAFQDPTHVSFWNKNSWLYYSNKEYRDLYNIKANFDIIKLEDMVTNQSIKIIHTHVIAKATKED